MAGEQLPQALPYEVEQALGSSQQYLAEIREIGSAAAALEQRGPEPAFERGNRLRHSGLGKPHRRRRAANALMPGHGLEYLQLPKTGEMLCGLHGSLIIAR